MEDTLDATMLWQARASLWELLALSFRYPGEELAESVASGEWADAAEEIAAAFEVALPAEFAADARAEAGGNAQALLEQMRPEATRLFVGLPKADVSPYEGVWRAGYDGVQALLFVNPHSMAVERFCKACGLGRPSGTNEPLDHVATECELLEYLALRAAGTMNLSGDMPEDSALPGGSAAAAYDTFLLEHLGIWANDFARALQGETKLPFYRAAAALLLVAHRTGA